VKIYNFDSGGTSDRGLRWLSSSSASPVKLVIEFTMRTRTRRIRRGTTSDCRDPRVQNTITRVFHPTTGQTAAEYNAQAPADSWPSGSRSSTGKVIDKTSKGPVARSRWCSVVACCNWKPRCSARLIHEDHPRPETLAGCDQPPPECRVQSDILGVDFRYTRVPYTSVRGSGAGRRQAPRPAKTSIVAEARPVTPVETPPASEPLSIPTLCPSRPLTLPDEPPPETPAAPLFGGG